MGAQNTREEILEEAIEPIEKKAHFLIVGLDLAGKTSFCYKMKPQKQLTTKFNKHFQKMEIYEYNDFMIYELDLRDSGKMAKSFKSDLQDLQGIIFVIDSSDKEENIVKAKKLYVEYMNVILDKSLPLLILANHRDQKCLSDEQLLQMLDVQNIPNVTKFHLQKCNVLAKQGLKEGMNWMHNELNDQ